MNLYIAIKGPKRGKIYDLTEDGLEEMFLRTSPETGHPVPTGYTGLILPFSSMEDDIIRLARHGQQVDERYFEYERHFRV